MNNTNHPQYKLEEESTGLWLILTRLPGQVQWKPTHCSTTKGDSQAVLMILKQRDKEAAGQA